MASSTLVGSSFFGIDLTQVTARWSSLRRKVARGQLLLEFDHGLLRYALGTVREGELDLSSIGRVDLPDAALERGVPTDPGQMAGLIRELCQEHQLFAHQVSVVLPTEAALLRVVELPAALSLAQAREQLLDPQMGLQLPIPLMQTDFDLVSCHLPLRRTADQQLLRRYLLVAVPRELTGKVLTTMELAELHLQRLEVAPLAAMRLKQQELRSLQRAEFDLWLELLPGRSVCTVVADSGPVAQHTLVAIRDFPEPELSAEQSQLCLKEGLTGEDITVRDSRYLPLSDLDLRVLVGEIQALQSSFSAGVSDCCWSRLWISGLNSAHPLLEELLGEQLDVTVLRVDPLVDPQLGQVGYARLLLCAALPRLVGLGLGLFPQQVLTEGPFDDGAWQVETDPLLLEKEPDLESEAEVESAALDVEVLDRAEPALLLESPEPELEPEPEPELEPTVDLSSLSMEPLDLNQEIDSLLSEESNQFIDLESEAWPSIQESQGETVEPVVSESEWPSIKQSEGIELGSNNSHESDNLERKDVGEVGSHDDAAQSQAIVDSTEESSFGELRFSDDS